MRKEFLVNALTHPNGIKLIVIVVVSLVLTAIVGTAARSIPVRLRWITSETGSSCSCGPL